MSGRIRQLKPELFFDEEFWALDEAHLELHLLRAFEGLWCHSDREGRFEWRPLMLRGKILPYWSGDFSRVLEVLRAAGYVQQYEVGGRYYGQVRSFHRHQRPNNREPESAIPAPPLEQTEGSLEHAQVDNSSVREPRASAPRASLPLLPTPTPDPDSRPAHASTSATPLHRERKGNSGHSRPARVFTMPCEEPPPDFLDAAVMAGVSRAQAASTWGHYWAAGLPEHGVEKLYPWLIKRAKERANQTTRMDRGNRPPPPAKPPERRAEDVLAEWRAIEESAP